MSSGPGNIIIRIGAETAGAIAGLNQVNSSLGDTMTAGQKATAGLRKAALPAAAALGAVGVAAIDATKAALEDAAAKDKLANQLDRVTEASASQIAAVDDYISKTSIAVGVTDDELRPALGKLATATGSVASAQDTLNLALDISAQTGKSLDTVTTALAKGYGGNTAALGKLVPGMDKAVLATKDMHQITGELADLTGGAAAESASTAEGQFRVWQIQMQELKETLGASLIPVMQVLLAIVTKVTGAVSEHTGIVKVAVAAIAALAGGILAANAAIKAYQAVMVVIQAATKAWTAIQWLLNAALTANPIGLVIAAVVALTAVIVTAYLKSETFRNIVNAAFAAVKNAAQTLANTFDDILRSARSAFDWIASHWKVGLFALGPIGVAIRLLIDNFDSLRSAGETAFNAIMSVVNSLSGAINGVIGAVESLIGALGRIRVPSIHLPHIPGLNVAPVPSPAGASKSSGSYATVGAGGTTINVYGQLDPEGTARTILRLLNDRERRQGR